MRALLAAAFALLAAAAAGAQEPDIVIEGSIDATAHQTYLELPFEVPPGVAALTVEFAYTGREERTTIDLGLADPRRFRGASGGNKSRFTLAETHATPSYLPGPIVPGTWKLLLGIPNIRKGARSDYTARIGFQRGEERPAGFADAPLATEARWYRGDFHAHSAHSDGSCASQAGARVPCPLFKTVEAAAARGLDFVTMSEHNATSHHNAMRELQPYYDRLLLLPGRELTTFFGHANIFGPTGFVDFRVGTAAVPDVDNMLGRVAALGGLVSINHPTAPSGELCMGCGWTARDTDWSRVQAIEVINGGSVASAGGQVETQLSGVGFWEDLLNLGHRLTAIGGSDNHDVVRDANRPGLPATVVFARDLSVPALLDGVRSGKVFVDVEGSRDRLLEFFARAGGAEAEMGGALRVGAGARVAFEARLIGAAGGRVEVIANGQVRAVDAPLAIDSEEDRIAFAFTPDRATRWVRVNVRGGDGRLLLIGNPIHLDR